MAQKRNFFNEHKVSTLLFLLFEFVVLFLRVLWHPTTNVGEIILMILTIAAIVYFIYWIWLVSSYVHKNQKASSGKR
ncbi:MAG: hypothetical protein LKF01_04605 [Lactobacillus sp.]|jgi:hypothetical protein|nr:hypothetical protein [Lactobacillus sp.]MCH3905903.1 hypothetical protein [Lactobacillus sp.]MCH3990521.1 hypothetical protein [Lactobacillus sp.]MCH4068764.1 hypothetical protein [Lactobacillus sp.]MCI1303751.1 hypothetical protein [Lactobacillus sp.]